MALFQLSEYNLTIRWNPKEWSNWPGSLVMLVTLLCCWSTTVSAPGWNCSLASPQWLTGHLAIGLVKTGVPVWTPQTAGDFSRVLGLHKHNKISCSEGLHDFEPVTSFNLHVVFGNKTGLMAGWRWPLRIRHMDFSACFLIEGLHPTKWPYWQFWKFGSVSFSTIAWHSYSGVLEKKLPQVLYRNTSHGGSGT